MPASDRARTARTLLNVETLEGRVVPAVVRPPIVANTALIAHLNPGASLTQNFQLGAQACCSKGSW